MITLEMLAEQLTRIETALAVDAINPELITLRGVMRMLDCESRDAAYRVLSALGVKPVTYGRYRRKAITNAIARREHGVDINHKPLR